MAGLTVANIATSFDINQIYARNLLEFVGSGGDLASIKTLIEQKPKPFVKWAGSKRQLLKQFRDLSLYTPAMFDPSINTYYEPFVGGGAFF